MQFFHKVGSSRKQKQKSLEAEALNFRELIDCLNEKNFKKLKEASYVSTKEIF